MHSRRRARCGCASRTFAVVLTNEAIEVHLSYLRPAVEALGDKLEELDKKLGDGLSKVNRKIDGKLDELNKKIDLRDKEHIERFSRIQASLDGLKWFISSTAILASGASIAHTLGWI